MAASTSRLVTKSFHWVRKREGQKLWCNPVCGVRSKRGDLTRYDFWSRGRSKLSYPILFSLQYIEGFSEEASDTAITGNCCLRVCRMEETENLRLRLDWTRPESSGAKFVVAEEAAHMFSDYFAGLTKKLIEEFDTTESESEKLTFKSLARLLLQAWSWIDKAYVEIPNLANPVPNPQKPSQKIPKSSEQLRQDIHNKAKEIRETTMPKMVTTCELVIAFIRLVEMRELSKQLPSIQEEVKNFESFRGDFTSLQTQKNESMVAIQKAQREVEAEATTIKELKTEIQGQSDSTADIQIKLDSKIAALDSTMKANVQFNNLAIRNFWVGRFWFFGMLVALSCTGCLVFWLFFEVKAETTTENDVKKAETEIVLKQLGEGWDAVAFVLQRLAVISPLLLVSKLALTKLNSCNHLRATYLHRISALTHYWNFEDAVEDKEARANLRLELAKMIFSDPQTGMIKQTDGTELNINGVIGALGKALPKH